MNNVNIVGIVDGDAEMVYQSREGGKSLFKFKVRVTRTFKNKLGEFQDDIINIKVWSTTLEDESMLHDQATLAIEGRIQSFLSKDQKNICNEVIADKVVYLV